MHPRNGGRIALRLLATTSETVSYDVTLFGPREQWSGAAEVTTAAGVVSFSGFTPDVPEWMCEWTRATLRTAWRNSKNEGWPRRIGRWRQEPASRGHE